MQNTLPPADNPSEVLRSTGVDAVEGVLDASPFFDLRYLFHFDVRTALGSWELDRQKFVESSAETFTTFDLLRERRLQTRREPFDLVPFQEDADNLLFSSEYLQQLPSRAFQPSCLVDHFNRFDRYIASIVEAQEFHTLNFSAFLLPAIYWSKPYVSSKQDPMPLIEGVEARTKAIHKLFDIRTKRIGELLSFQNDLIYSYVLLCNALGVGLSATIFNDHLFVYRRLFASTWLTLNPHIRLQYAVLCVHMANRFFPVSEPFKTKFGFSMNSLYNFRLVLEDAFATASSYSRQLQAAVFQWYLEKIDTEVFSSERGRSVHAAFPTLSRSERSIIVDVARRLSSYRYPITVDTLEAFIQQFGSANRIRATIRLLAYLRFCPLWQMCEGIERLLLDSTSCKRKVLSIFGDRTGSASIMNYIVSHSTLRNVDFADGIEDALKRTQGDDEIHFIDDCAVSGTQTLNIVGDLLGTRDRKEWDTVYCQPLAPALRKELMNRTLVFLFFVVCDEAIRRLPAGLAKMGFPRSKTKIRYAAVDPIASKAFEVGSYVPWLCEDERSDIKAFCAEVGYDVLEGIAQRKHWPDARRRENALGYSDFQRLLVFPYSAPKTSVTCLWQGKEGIWMPLFPVAE